MIAFGTLLLGVMSGVVPVELLVADSVASVRVEWNGEAAGKALPPAWTVEVDLGPEPAPGLLEAVALDSHGRELERARQWVNLPRPPVALELFLGPDASGRLVAQLAWEAVEGDEPLDVRVWLDGLPVPGDGSSRFTLPRLDPDTLHFLRAQVDFPGDLAAVREVTFGGRHGDTVHSELAAVPLLLDRRREPPLVELQGRLESEGRPLSVVALEKPKADLVVVVDRSTHGDLSRLHSAIRRERMPGDRATALAGRRDVRFVAPLPSDAWVRILYSHADERVGRGVRRSLFPSSPERSAWEGGLLWQLLSAPQAAAGSEQRLADAVAVAGVLAAQRGHRRAVLLLLGREPADASGLTPGAARRYLERLGVPLFVWVTSPGVPATAEAWGEVEQAGWLPAFEGAAGRLARNLARQRIAWVEGFHAPQRIVARGSLPGVQMLASDPPPQGEERLAPEVASAQPPASDDALAPPEAEEGILAPPPATAGAEQQSPAAGATGAPSPLRPEALGPWRLDTDVADRRLLEALAATASDLPEIYSARFGLPRPEVAGDRVVLFRQEEDFRDLMSLELPEGDRGIQGHARDGVATLYVGERSLDAVRSTLVHELAHLLNQRAFGTSLPTWLEEGMAEDLAYSQVDRQGRLLPGTLRVEVEARERGLAGQAQQRQGRTYEVTMAGSLAALAQLLDARRRGTALPLAELIDLDEHSFRQPAGREVRYAAAGYFVRFLLEGGGGRAGTRRREGFLRLVESLASGDPGGAGTAGTVERALGEPLPDVERAFYSWLRFQRATALR